MQVPQLSSIEERIILLLTDGWSRSGVAADLNLDERTVEWHLVQATRKLASASTLHDRFRRAVPTLPIHSTSSPTPGRTFE